jgi:hypothetical protein
MPTVKKSIHAKLMDARKAFHKLPLKKSGFNSFSKYHYFELSDFLIAGMACMSDEGLMPVISFDDDLATMTIHDIEADATITITSPMKEIVLKGSNAMQALGGCETYNTRYLWVAALQICENDLLDSQPPAKPVEQEAKPEPAKAPALATEKDYITIKEYIEDDQIPAKTLEWLQKNYEGLTHSQALKVIKVCKSMDKGE